MTCKRCHKEIKDCLENLDLISNEICLECYLCFNVTLKSSKEVNQELDIYSNKSLLNLRPHELAKKFGTKEEQKEMKQGGIYFVNYTLRELFKLFIDYENMNQHNSFNELKISYQYNRNEVLEKENKKLKEQLEFIKESVK